MATPTYYYVDPAINANSGTGTIGDPFGDLQYALNSVTRNATSGDQFNVKAGTAEVLAAALTLATYGTPTAPAPLILRGYTSAADDGGIGKIDANGVTAFTSAYAQVRLINMEVYNFGNNNGVNLGVGSVVHSCNIHKGISSPTSKTLVTVSYLIASYVHDAGTTGIGCTVTYAYGNYVYNCPNRGVGAQFTIDNIIVNSDTTGIENPGGLSIGNTIYNSNNATGRGIFISQSTAIIFNNIIVGYSGSGGKGITDADATRDLYLMGYNSFYNNATNVSVSSDVFINLTSNDTAFSSAPFVDAAGGNFALKTTATQGLENALQTAWYGTAATTNKQERGAVQNGAGSGGGISRSRAI